MTADAAQCSSVIMVFGAGPLHAAAGPGSPDEEIDGVDSNNPLADGTLADQDAPIEDEPEPYSGLAGGAVGGTSVNKRATGGCKEIETSRPCLPCIPRLTYFVSAQTYVVRELPGQPASVNDSRSGQIPEFTNS